MATLQALTTEVSKIVFRGLFWLDIFQSQFVKIEGSRLHDFRTKKRPEDYRLVSN